MAGGHFVGLQVAERGTKCDCVRGETDIVAVFAQLFDWMAPGRDDVLMYNIVNLTKTVLWRHVCWNVVQTSERWLSGHSINHLFVRFLNSLCHEAGL